MSRNTGAGGLRRVRGEIDRGLQRVRRSLDSFAPGVNGGGADLAAAIGGLGEIRAVLTSLQLVGPARLVSEMRRSCEALAQGAMPDPAGASETLTQALDHLPVYLARLAGGQPDAPPALLPVLNDLRASRGEGPLGEAELLVPTSVIADAGRPSPEVREALARLFRRVRPHFHRYLVQLFRPETSREGMANLGRLFHRLQRHIGGGVFHELFLAAEAVVEAMLDGGIEPSGEAKALIGRLDRVVKPFSEGPDAWPELEAEALFGGLMSLIARCESSAHLVHELRRVYGLQPADEGEPEGGREHPSGRRSGDAGGPGMDPELLKIFLEEAEELEQAIRDQFGRWRDDPADDAALASLKRSFRTLKGSGRLVGADRFGELSRAVEGLLGTVGDGSVRSSTAVVEGVGDAVALLPELIAAEAAARPLDTGDVIERLDRLADAGRGPEAARETRPSAKVIPWPP
jgi:chemosensory pili system protein ChpA (sensor histidine kinase/response regulator)